MPISCVPDHVAAAVPSIADAQARWRDRLGGGDHGGAAGTGAFRFHQHRFRGGGVLELIEDASEDRTGFVRRFLDRFGARVHHVTLKVPDLGRALGTVGASGLEAVDVDLSDERWQEAFVRPSQVGGLIVQLAATTMTNDDWAEATGFARSDPAPDGARLLGPLLDHPDLDRARHVWTSLGGTIEEVGTERFEVRWGDAPLTVHVRRGEVAQPVGLRFADAPPLPADPALGPAVLPV